MPTILVVDDDDINGEMLGRLLARSGFSVTRASDGLQAIFDARRDQPDLILMDQSMPGIDGWEATRRLKADPATARIPVIALTAHALQSHRAAALAAGCDEFETKPVDMGRLIPKIAKLLERRPVGD